MPPLLRNARRQTIKTSLSFSYNNKRWTLFRILGLVLVATPSTLFLLSALSSVEVDDKVHGVNLHQQQDSFSQFANKHGLHGTNQARKKTMIRKQTSQQQYHRPQTNKPRDLYDVNPPDTIVPPDTPPMTMSEISHYIMAFLHKLHSVNKSNKKADHFEIWQSYHDLVVKTLYPWDREYLQRMPPRREDGSIFLSVATYRDENCLNTITEAYQKAKYPERLFLGLVQQNCVKDCKSGVLSNLRMEPVEPDEDCYTAFCATPLGKPHCQANRVRSLFFNEDESLGPYAARYFASKLWYGEQWYMQIDAHMFFAQDWDETSIQMMKNAPTEKPVMSNYPPSHQVKLEGEKGKPAHRLCGAIFAESDLESQIIRLSTNARYDKTHMEVSRFAPFTAAGYFFAHSGFLIDVPFDPFLPWIFMGEEIIMSARLWTSGYDIYSPTENIVSHIYVRRHKPKFWESVHRLFRNGVHNPLQMLILNRIKYQLGYPESSRDFVLPQTLLTAVEEYGMGTERSVEAYLEDVAGLDMMKKVAKTPKWCEDGIPPPGMEQYLHLFQTKKYKKKTKKKVK